jgi:uncharacterized RDD family membrane protein YckC
MAKLLVQESAGVREFELVDNEVHIGRELDNTLRLADPSISRHHCVIRKGPVGFEIQDLQSSNGVLLNGSRVQTAALRDGDRLTLGQIHLTFVDPEVQGSTVAVRTGGVVPGGTVRMSADEVAAAQAAEVGALSPPTPMPAAPLPAAPMPAAPMPPPPPAPPVYVPPPPMPAAPPPPMPMPAAPMPAGGPPPLSTTENVSRPRPPAPPAPPKQFGEFTNPGAAGAPGASRPVQAGSGGGFLDKYLPPIPDDAQPTGERGDFVTRLLAMLIDAVPIFIIVIVFMVLSFIVGMIPGVGLIGGCLLSIIQLVVVLGYAWYLMPMWVSKYGATPGKKMMKLRIVPEDNPYGRLTFGQAIVRQICHILNFTIGYLLIFGAERKAVHDMITKTIVIKVDR